jgi:cbb3-type cytochrome oxidase subunit 3
MITLRDFIAALFAIALLLGALSLATTLTVYRKRRRRTRDEEQAQGRRIIAEIPGDDDLRLFTEDDRQFHYGTQAVDKDRIVAVRVLINGVPIAAYVARRFAHAAAALHPTSFEDRPEGIARDRWDVAIEQSDGVMLVECGAIRERVSQELARAVFDAVKRELERLDR